MLWLFGLAILSLIAAFRLGQFWESQRHRDPVINELDALRRHRDSIILASGRPTFQEWPDESGGLTLVMTRLPSQAVWLLRKIYESGSTF